MIESKWAYRASTAKRYVVFFQEILMASSLVHFAVIAFLVACVSLLISPPVTVTKVESKKFIFISCRRSRPCFQNDLPVTDFDSINAIKPLLQFTLTAIQHFTQLVDEYRFPDGFVAA